MDEKPGCLTLPIREIRVIRGQSLRVAEKVFHRLQSQNPKHLRRSLELTSCAPSSGSIPLVGTAFLWRAIFHESGGGMRGYDYGAVVYHYLLTILVGNLVTPTEDEWPIAADIHEGQINSFLTKPVNYLGYRFSVFLSGRLVYTAVTILPLAAIFFSFRRFPMPAMQTRLF